MIKFKRQNIKKLAEENGISYCALDVLRQETIVRLVEIFKIKNYSCESIKSILKKNINYLLDLMVIDK